MSKAKASKKPPAKARNKSDKSDIQKQWAAYLKKRDVHTRNAIVEHYSTLVYAHASRLTRRLPAHTYDEICSAAFDGLMEAVQAYDPSRQAKFETFCQQRITGAVMDWLRSLDAQSRIVRTFEKRRMGARVIDIRTAAAICEAVAGTQVERVAVFRDASWDEIDRVLRRAEFERIQFHGEETEDEVEAVDLPVIKAIPGADVEAAETYPGTILLLDHPSEGGGKGKVWDWSEASGLIELGHDVILAGGLDPDNVSRALDDVGDVLPWGVDVATGVETDGYRKDTAKMKAFVQAVREVEDSVPTVEESE